MYVLAGNVLLCVLRQLAAQLVEPPAQPAIFFIPVPVVPEMISSD
jgi:hypothetical protein